MLHSLKKAKTFSGETGSIILTFIIIYFVFVEHQRKNDNYTIQQ